MVHPKCDPKVWKISDFVGSTSKMHKETLASKASKFIVATEIGLLHRLKRIGEMLFYASL